MSSANTFFSPDPHRDRQGAGAAGRGGAGGSGLAGTAHEGAPLRGGSRVRNGFARTREAAGRYGIEALVLALLALTVAAVAFQDRLLTRTIAFTPASHPKPATYTDQDMGGDSQVAIDRSDPLAWRCELRRKFAYPYCGYELLTKPESFLVEDAEGPLAAGELDRARDWGSELAATAQR